jgi:predicted secreted acid phosphatase
VRGTRLVRGALLFAAGALASGAIAWGAGSGSGDLRETAVSDGTSIYGLNPTGVGLPLVGAHGTIGAGDYASALKAYHDSGDYQKDLNQVGGQAEDYLVSRLAQLRRKERRCKRRINRSAATRKQKRRRKKRCRQPPTAIVLDIDETSLSNYEYLAASNFTNTTGQQALAVAAANTPPVQPTLDLYRLAKSRGMAIFFITGRPASIPGVRDQTEANLKSAGYTTWNKVILNPSLGGPAIPYKSGERAKIEQQGFRIVLNLGDQESDLRGGHADRAFKLPNPFYFIE